MKYLFLLHITEEPLPTFGTPEYGEMFATWRSATEAMAQAGVLIDCAPLEPASAATTVRIREGETLLTDGPAAEIKEQVGGYTLVECSDLDEALKWAATLPTAIALSQWAAEGLPANPRTWLVSVAHHKAVDWLRREARRCEKEAAAVPKLGQPDTPQAAPSVADDELALIFMCCHPALDRGVRVALTLRSVCGLSTTEIGGAFLVPESTMAKRLRRAKHKIRQAGIPFRIPPLEDLPKRLDDVLRLIYLVFTEGHMATTGPQLVRDDLCVTAIDLARKLRVLLPEEPEVIGLLALLLLTDAR